jgi:hypothetical protein
VHTLLEWELDEQTIAFPLRSNAAAPKRNWNAERCAALR